MFELRCRFSANCFEFLECLFLLYDGQEDRDWSDPSVTEGLNPGHIGPQYSKHAKGGEEDESKLHR